MIVDNTHIYTQACMYVVQNVFKRCVREREYVHNTNRQATIELWFLVAFPMPSCLYISPLLNVL